MICVTQHECHVHDCTELGQQTSSAWNHGNHVIIAAVDGEQVEAKPCR